jgi:hypothetical protein
LNETIHFLPEFVRGGGEHGPARVHHDVPLRGDVAQTQPKLLAKPSPGAIPANCDAESPRDSKPDPRPLLLISVLGKQECGEVRPAEALPVFIDAPKIRGSKDPRTFGEAEPIWRCGRLFRRSP